MSDAEDESPWSQATQDHWFYGALAGSVLAVGALFLPYLDALLFAATTVVVTWPVYSRVLDRCGGRKVVASAVTSALILGLVLVPLSVLALWFLQQAMALTTEGVRFVSSGEAQTLLDEGLTALEFLGIPVDNPREVLIGSMQEAVFTIGQTIGTVAPALVGSFVDTAIDGAVYVFAVITLYIDGPRVARALMQLSPMNDRYEERLFYVFREFSNNLVIGSLATAAIQGAVAGIGFWLVGVEQVVFFSILTAVMSFFPVFGTAIVWGPLVLYVGAVEGTGWAAVLMVWSVGLTGTVDNLVRPFFLRGQSDIHPLLIFLAVLGGITWMGFPGALVGPVLVAAFLALFTIYREDYLGLPPVAQPPSTAGMVDRMLEQVGTALGVDFPPPSELSVMEAGHADRASGRAGEGDS